ncbi:hypothetical protein I316_02474 [Kwoniella heveanensis BCC8398]|uniref:Uncharacterized protein n=1 Tax=Kwoniella heveanensis BCC8398 TaxID=1296120 RepID=A0A1B9GY84_9TREE|nr:hypothetical protein I316_02474 [Kwoniella heveanensis BCC8398]
MPGAPPHHSAYGTTPDAATAPDTEEDPRHQQQYLWAVGALSESYGTTEDLPTSYGAPSTYAQPHQAYAPQQATPADSSWTPSLVATAGFQSLDNNAAAAGAVQPPSILLSQAFPLHDRYNVIDNPAASQRSQAQQSVNSQVMQTHTYYQTHNDVWPIFHGGDALLASYRHVPVDNDDVEDDWEIYIPRYDYWGNVTQGLIMTVSREFDTMPEDEWVEGVLSGTLTSRPHAEGRIRDGREELRLVHEQISRLE